MDTILPHRLSPSPHAEPLSVSARSTDESAYSLNALQRSTPGKEPSLKVEPSLTEQQQGSSGGGHADETLLPYGLAMNEHQQVDWAGGNAHHPRNWPASRKVFDTSVVIFLDFFTCVPSPLIPNLSLYADVKLLLQVCS